MFAEVLSESVIVEPIKETEAEDGSHVKLELRVKDRKRWSKMMTELLVGNIDEEDYGISINKAYWADPEKEKIVYCWVLIVWGDLNQAIADLAPILSKKTAKPAPPPMEATMPEGQVAGATIVRRRRLRQGGRAVDIRLPHRTPRLGHGGRTKKASDIGRRGQWGFAQAIGGDDGGDPWY